MLSSNSANPESPVTSIPNFDDNGFTHPFGNQMKMVLIMLVKTAIWITLGGQWWSIITD